MSEGSATTTAAAAGQGLLVKGFHEESLTHQYDWRLLRRLIPYLRPHRGLLAVALLLMPIASAASLLQPYLIKKAIDASLVSEDMGELLQVVVFFAVAIVAEFVVRFGQTYTMQLAGQRAMADLRRATFRHIQRLRVSYFDRTPIGRVVTRVTNDVDSLSEFFSSGAVTAIADLLTLFGIVAIMLSLDWQLSLVAFAALPPLAIVVNIFRRFARRAFRDIRLRIAQLNAYLNEQVQGVDIVQAFGREEQCAEEYRTINDAYRRANHRAIRFDALLYSVVEAVSVACVAMVLFTASAQAELLGDPTAAAAYIGTVVAFYEYIHRFFIPIRDLATKYTIIQSSLASAERIFSLLDVNDLDAPTLDCEDAPNVGSDIAVAFRNVTFAYREDHPVLHDVNLDIARGERIAVVGATGSGKTTLTSLLLRLYELQLGHILVDGRDIRGFDRHALRQRFGVVPQDVFLFRGTVLANVAVGDDVPDRARAENALRRAAAWEVLQERGGLDATVSARGTNFSAGERQLIAFARALYRDAPILVLDEATANIDSETEARLQTAVHSVLHGRTAIVIAHRLSTIREADRIVVVHHGRIAEQGTHEQLLAQPGIYARLHQLQFSEFSGTRPPAGA